MSCRNSIIAVGVTALVVMSRSVSPAASDRGERAVDVAAAIAWGRAGTPEAYPLRSAFPTNPTPPGVVYTPFLRVALAARAAREGGRSFAVEDVSPDMVAPQIEFAICDQLAAPPQDGRYATGQALSTAPLKLRLLAVNVRPGSHDRLAIQPLSVRHQLPDYQRYGLRPTCTYTVGAFATEQVEAGMQVELYRAFRDVASHQAVTVPGIVTDSDLEAWK